MPPPQWDIPPGDMIDGIDMAYTPAARPGIVGLLWRWRYEFGSGLAIAGSAIGLELIAGTSGLIAGTIIAVFSAVAAMSWPPSRNRIAARVRCVVVQHRVRVGCAAAWVQTRSGKLPVIMWTVPRPFGESVMLWCRPGITAGDLVRAREVLRVACWAVDVQVIPDARRPHRVRLDIIRVNCVDHPPTEDWSDGTVDDADAEPHLPHPTPLPV
jgi:hypothetical protein